MINLQTLSYWVILLCSILPLTAFATETPPPWMNGHMPPRANHSYYFKIVPGEGRSFTQARQNAVHTLVQELANSQGVTIDGKAILELGSQYKNGRHEDHIRQQSSFQLEHEQFKTRFEIADQYLDEKGICWVLFEVAINPEHVAFVPVSYTSNYGLRGTWRSILLPGWGQMHKRSYGKGVTLLLLQGASVAAAVTCEYTRIGYQDMASTERNTGVRKQYAERSDTFEQLRNASLLTAGVLYLYNIIDATTAKGAKRYKRYRVSASPVHASLSIPL